MSGCQLAASVLVVPVWRLLSFAVTRAALKLRQRQKHVTADSSCSSDLLAAAGLQPQPAVLTACSTPFALCPLFRDGFDVKGLDKYGYDKDGYDKDGYNKRGLDRQGFDKNGKDK